jgi:hypothetical protein
MPFAGRSAVFVLKPLEIGLGIDGKRLLYRGSHHNTRRHPRASRSPLPKLIGGA